MKTREQIRADYAWSVVGKLASLGIGDPKDFATTCKQTAARVINAGLGGALAFSLAKSKEKEHQLVAAALAGHLYPLLRPDMKKTPIDQLVANGGARQFLTDLMARDALTLRASTDEAMALLVWLARLADGLAAEGKSKGAQP